MTPEERFTKIENLLSAMTERHDGQIEKNNLQIEKNTAGIRDLIQVSRTLIDAQLKTDEQIQALHRGMDGLRYGIEELREEGKAIDARLSILIEIVDRLIRSNGKDTSS